MLFIRRLRSLLAEHGISRDLSLAQLVKLSANKKAYLAYKKELSDQFAIDLSDDLGSKFLNDPDLQKEIEDAARNEMDLE